MTAPSDELLVDMKQRLEYARSNTTHFRGRSELWYNATMIASILATCLGGAGLFGGGQVAQPIANATRSEHRAAPDTDRLIAANDSKIKIEDELTPADFERAWRWICGVTALSTTLAAFANALQKKNAVHFAQSLERQGVLDALVQSLKYHVPTKKELADAIDDFQSCITKYQLYLSPPESTGNTSGLVR